MSKCVIRLDEEALVTFAVPLSIIRQEEGEISYA